MSEDELMAPPVDRRSSSRQAASIPAAVLSESWSVCAVIDDVSDTGALLLTRENLEVGTLVDVHVLLGTTVRPPVKAVVTVVRSQLREGKNLLWSHEVAVRFESQRGPWAEAMGAVTRRQADLRRTDT